MIERFEATLDNRQGTTRRVYTNNPDAVVVELAADYEKRYAVRITPSLMHFSDEFDYVLEVTNNGDGTFGHRALFGSAPAWVDDSVDWANAETAPDATLIASPEGSTYKA